MRLGRCFTSGMDPRQQPALARRIHRWIFQDDLAGETFDSSAKSRGRSGQARFFSILSAHPCMAWSTDRIADKGLWIHRPHDKVGLDEFTEEDERLAAILASQVGRVYQNGSLYADAWHTPLIWRRK